MDGVEASETGSARADTRGTEDPMPPHMLENKTQGCLRSKTTEHNGCGHGNLKISRGTQKLQPKGTTGLHGPTKTQIGEAE